jgi:hypothetical protein
LIETEPLTRVMEVLTTAEGRQREATSKRIFLEVTLLKAIQAREATSLDAVLKQLKALRDAVPQQSIAGVSPALSSPAQVSLEKSIASHLAPPPVALSVPREMPAPIAAPTVSAPPAALVPLVAPGDKEGLLTALLARLPFSQRTMLSDGQAIALTDKIFTIGVTADHFNFLDPKRDEPILTAKLSELGVGDVSVKLVPLAASAPADAAPKSVAVARPTTATKPVEPKPAKAAPVQLNKDEFMNDPLIKQAVEIFKATLVEVRAPGVEV